jgi:hypothetical protein
MNQSLDQYESFLRSKRIAAPSYGFSVDDSQINQQLFRWQRDIDRWALRKGRAALFEDCGLGKTPQQLEWAARVANHTDGMVLLLLPLAVGPQTLREHGKFNIDCECRIVTCQGECRPGINITNYEKLDHFWPDRFAGVVLDESSILKSYTGKTKRKLLSYFAKTPYRLACTATPAPNDLMELGNHAEFLGIMPSNEMLARWFINEGKSVGKYRLRKHARKDFWRWVASWAICVSKPSDLGHSDEGYILPPLEVNEHIIESSPPPGYLFASGNVSATEVHQEKRSSLEARSDKVAELANDDCDQWAVWCDTDYEADALRKRIPDAVEVRGSHSDRIKEERLTGFTTGKYRVIITKPEIGGFGLNWQHCHKTTWFAGYSYEKFYQAIRRMLRFGQKLPVEVHVVLSEVEQSIADVVRRKQAEHDTMKSEMAEAMKEFQLENLYGDTACELSRYRQTVNVEVPEWIQSKA